MYNLTVMTLQVFVGASGIWTNLLSIAAGLDQTLIIGRTDDGQALRYHCSYKKSTADGLQTTRM